MGVNGRKPCQWCTCAVDELELAARNEVAHGRLLLGRLIRPPALEESLLDLDELAVGILEQREHRRADDTVDVAVLDRVVRSVVVPAA